MRTEGLGREELLARIADFHGHLGPYVLLGFRAGRLALRLLGAKGYFDLEAVAGCGNRPPVSCFADGVQLGSGCTTGKGNLRIEPCGTASGGSTDRASPSETFGPADHRKAEAVVTFRLRPTEGGAGAGGDTGAGSDPAHTAPRQASVTVRVRPEVEALGARWLAEASDREAARRLLDLTDDELFEVRWGEGGPSR